MAKSTKQKTWGGRFKQGPAKLMQQFSESVSFDARLAPYDIACSKAHASMLCRVKLISAKERDAICKGLDALLKSINAGKFKWDIALEDVHMNIEQALIAKVPAAAKLHTARSRNDQVATDMRLFFKDAVLQLDQALNHILKAIIKLAEAGLEVYVPGYTHMQRAQPVSVAHHLLAYAEMFGRDKERFLLIAKAANVCPLGSGAIAGTTLPIDREFVAKKLGFVDKQGKPLLTQNSMDAVADRDLFLDFAHACAVCGAHFSRMAEDLILWNTTEFNFIKLPDAYTTGSSMMPQKKNPDSLELARGKAARLMGHVATLYALVKGLPLTYNRDLQEDKPPVFDALDQTSLCLQVLAATLAGAKLNKQACAHAVSDPTLLATDLADYFVLRGVAFRDAHHAVGELVAIAEHKKCQLNDLSLSDVQAVCKAAGKDWATVFDLKRSQKMRENIGMPGPKQVKKQIARWKKRIV